jgi:AsmA family/AsmA-like C-terminal region
VVKIFSSRRRLIAAAAFIVLVLFWLRPGASRLKSRIVLSMSSALGRSVDIGSVQLRLLPRPGFDLNDLVVYDDPAFGAEPMLRAGEVTANLRLMSLIRGRIEIARLDLTEPSLNLVHGPNGRWNLEALLERTARTPLAPTAKAKTEPRPAFPYIEATSARINFKDGPEKKPYALTDAAFSLWQDSENTWGVRLKAQPFRTDLNLNDTGLLRVNGTWQRAATLRETPVMFSIEWDRPQLGQLSKFFTGNDQGWRGGAQIEATLTGTPANLHIVSDASVQDFRRYDITAGQPLRLAAHCDGQYSSPDREFQAVVCTAPVAGGLVTLKGSAALPSHSYKLEVTAEGVPVRPVVALAQRAKKNLADDLSSGGIVQGSISIEKSAMGTLRLEGRGEIEDFTLASEANEIQIGPQTIPFVWTVGNSVKGSVSTSLRKPADRKNFAGLQAPAGPHLEFGPCTIGPHGAATEARGWIDRTSYGVSLTGEAEIARTLRLARMLGIQNLHANPEGSAQLNLQIAGSLGHGNPSGFGGPQVTGSAKLHNVRVAIRGTAAPLEISSAEMQLTSDWVRIAKLSAKAAGTSWMGSLEMPRGCGTPSACQIHFNLAASGIALGDLREWASPPPADRPWYRVLETSSASGPSFLANLRAAGHVDVDHLQIRNFTANHVSANVTLNRGKIDIAGLDGNFLGSQLHGAWHADYTVQPAACEGTGSFADISLARLNGGAAGAASGTALATASAAKPEMTNGPAYLPGIAGIANATYHVKGKCGADFWPSADGTLEFDIRDGILAHISLTEDEGPLKIVSFSGQARLRDGNIELKDARLDSSGGKFQVSGTASLQRELDLKLSRIPSGSSAAGYAITGTLAEPHVAPLPGAEQARLKTEPGK